MVTLLVLVTASGLSAQSNGRFTLSIDAPCGEVVAGPPGNLYDDETLGIPYYTEWRTFADGVRRRVARQRRGHTWDIVLTSADNPDWGVNSWKFALGVEGPLRIVDITTDGTAGCSAFAGFYPECRRSGGIEETILVDPVESEGPNADVAAFSFVLLKLDGAQWLPSEGTEVVCKIRVFGEFPEQEGEAVTSRIYFTTWDPPNGDEQQPTVYAGLRFLPITVDSGDPPLTVEDCVVTLKASNVGPFIRCDANDDGLVDLSDAVTILGQLFLGRPMGECRVASDCNRDDAYDVSDAVYGLSHLFLGTPPPPRPFPDCGRVDVPVEECPPGSTRCAD